VSRLDTLKKLESTLERFLEKAVAVDEKKYVTWKSLDALDNIARDSLRGRYINNRLGDWFASNKRNLDEKRFNSEEMESIANLLGEIRSGLDEYDPGSKKLSEEIENWRESETVPKRKLIIKGKLPKEETGLFDKFVDLLKRQSEYLESGEFEGHHLLSVLDDVLKSASAKIDRTYLHMAGSIIYYLKLKGYKVTPYVKRLKEIEKEKGAVTHAD